MSSLVRCHDVAQAIELEGLSPLPEPLSGHIAECTNCQGLVSDFNSILNAAHELPAEVDPPARVWLSIRAQLVADGLIHEAPALPAFEPRAHWWHGFSGLLRGRALATAAVGLLLFAAAIVQLRTTPTTPSRTAQPVASQVAQQTSPAPVAPVAEPARTRDTLQDTGLALSNQEHELRSVQTAGTLSSSPVDDSLQKNLQTLDAFIAECEQHLQSNPQDELAREYLAGAYQQKAELLAEMLDRGRSVN